MYTHRLSVHPATSCHVRPPPPNSDGLTTPNQTPHAPAERGFLSVYERARTQVEGLTTALTSNNSPRLRENRLAAIFEVVEGFGQAPSIEIEAVVLKNLGPDLEQLLETVHSFIVLGQEDCEALATCNPNQAQRWKERAIRLQNWAIYWKANLLYARDRYPEAMSAFQRVMARDPTFPRRESIYSSLGMAWEHIVGNLERSDEMYSRVIEIRKGRLKALQGENRLGQHPPDSPVITVGEEARLTPIEAVALALERRGDLRMKRRTYALAAQDYKEAVKLRVHDPVARRKHLRARVLQLTMPFSNRRG